MDPRTEPGLVHETMVEPRSAGVAATPAATPGAHRNAEVVAPDRPVPRWLVRALMLTVVLAGAGVFALYKMRVNIPAMRTTQLYAQMDTLGARLEPLKRSFEGFLGKHAEAAEHSEHNKIVTTSPKKMDITIPQEYVCQIHSQRHIEVCALEDGYLEAIKIKEGQLVKADQLMFQIRPVIYKAELAAEEAERDLAQMELTYSETLAAKSGISQKEVSLYKAKLARAQAKVSMAQAKLNFASIKAPFDGIIDKLRTQEGALVKEGDMLTTLSDNSWMWVYFNVPERRYLQFMAETGQNKQSPDIHLKLADQKIFPEVGKIGAIESDFNNTNGNIPFRADFPNPHRLLRHGQTGTVIINRPLKDAIIIPQRATFEILDKRYVFVIDKDDMAHQREIEIDHEMEDIFVIAKGLAVDERFVLEGVRDVRDGDKVEAEFRTPDEALKVLKFHAE